ncbi:hypothetical protein DES45_11266 [Microvirga subterranea]|uniref:Integrase-like protein n=1 Tax=Microvirga subterranea TaxID=186651 RepID=A0A370HA91_9HYPH|nr:hypothetical protein DES45_11266 [Microvirga subterranea]
MLLWEEYCDSTPEAFSYSWFCEHYKDWVGRLKPTLRQVHVAGEKLFVDYSGHTMEVIDGPTGEVRPVQIFVAVLGASNYTYAEASFTQSLPDWIGSHVRTFAFLGGATRQTVSDNLKAGITKACFPRADGQSHLCRHSASLRHRHRAGPALQAARQGEGRGRRSGGRALDPGPPAQPPLLLAAGPQWGHPRSAA